MSQCRQQVLIEAPMDRVWALVGDPGRHPDWMPRVVEVRGERFEVGDKYAQITQSPVGRRETTMIVDNRDEMRELKLHCTKTGMFTNWALTDARGNTFVDCEFGMDAKAFPDRMWDRAFGRRYFRNWMAQSVEALGRAAKTRAAAVGTDRAD
jgi:hypothetical protein